MDETPAPGILHEPVERRPAVLRPADAVVDVFHGRLPATSREVAAELGELVLGLLTTNVCITTYT